MKPHINPTIVKLQIVLNKRMYENGKISYDIYSLTNEILSSKLTYNYDDAIINHSKRK